MVTGHAKEAIVLGAAAAQPTKGGEEEMGEEDPPTKTEEEKTWRRLGGREGGERKGGYLSGGGGGEKMQQRLFVPEEGRDERRVKTAFLLGESTGLLLCRILATKKNFICLQPGPPPPLPGSSSALENIKEEGGREGGLCCHVVAPFVLPGYAREAKRRFPRFLFSALSGFFLESPLEKERDAHLPSFQHSKVRRASPPGHTGAPKQRTRSGKYGGKSIRAKYFFGLFQETFPLKLKASQLESDFFSPLLSFPPPFLLRQANGLDKS